MTSMDELATMTLKALSILTHRLHTLIALVMVFGLFCWAMAIGTWIHFAIAGAFGVSIFLPVLMHDKTSGVPHE